LRKFNIYVRLRFIITHDYLWQSLFLKQIISSLCVMKEKWQEEAAMNPPTHSEAQHWTRGRWDRLAWVPIALLLAAIIAARMAGLRGSYESHTLLLVLSFIFYTLVSLGTLYLIGRSFLALGSPGLLLLECGVVLWSLAGTVGDFVSHGDANINVSIFNVGILLAGLCHLSGTILTLRPQRVLRAEPLWLGAGFAFALGALWLVSQAALMGWLPVFFIPGHGGTPVRYVVLGSAITMFVLAAGLLKANQRTTHLPFTSWYALALLMLAVGLFGVMIQLALGSVVNWLSRTAQWLGGVYLLFAAFASLRESQLPLLPPEKQSNPAYYRDGVAVAMVLAAAAIRLTFLSAMGLQAPFVTFYPAMMFASLYGGLRAGLLATALSAIIVDYFWIEPVGQFTIARPSDWLAIMTFLLTGVIIAVVSDTMHRARARAFTAEKQALLATERAAAAEALQESKAQLDLALLSAHMGTWYWDIINNKRYFDNQVCHLLGTDPIKFTGAEEEFFEILHPDDVTAIKAALTRTIEEDVPYETEYRVVWPDGSIHYISARGMLVRDDAGRPARINGIIWDITDRRRAEEERERLLAEIENRAAELDATISSMATGLIVYDTTGKAIRMNDTAKELLPQETFFNMTVEERARVIRWETEEERPFPAEEVPVARALKGETSHNVIIAASFPDRKLWISASAAPILTADDRMLGVVASFVDITKRKQAEEALKDRTAKLEEINKELESFSYSISHDLRAPLRAIDGYARMLLKKHGQEFDEDSMRKFNDIRSNAQMMGKLIDDILTLSRLGRAKMSIVDLDMEGIITDVWKELQTINPERNMSLTIQAMPSGYGDRTLIKQVYANLIGNAVKFTKYKNPAQIEAGGYTDGNENVYYVKDNGTGFDMAYYDKLFGIFQRLHNNPDFEGTGVGLATIQRAVHRHGGRVWAEGKVNEGATFYFSLPSSHTQ
jgi:PAS domain S-box-containing protein